MRLANRFILLGLAIFAALASSGQTVYVQPMRYDHYAITQQASIGAGVVRVTAPSAYLEIGPTSGATKGLLGPRLTTTERNAIASPADGLLIYNSTTKKYNYYDGGSSSWKDIGSGSAGGGITQLGSSPWGLTILDDSTYLVDSMKVLTKYQGEKTRDSLSVLINLKLAKSDTTAMLSPLWTQIGKKVDTQNVVQIDTTDRSNGKIVYWDATARKYKHKTDSVGTVGGSSGSGGFSKLEWFPGDENAPANGDTILVHDSFPGKFLDVYRDGIKQPHVYNDTGFYRLTDSSIKVKPPFSSSDKFWHIEARDSTAYTQLVLEAPDAPPSTTIAYVSSTDGGNNGGSGNTRTFSHTTGSGTDRYLLVGVIGDVTSGANDPVSVTYNGVSMTMIDSMKAVQGGNRYNYVWGLANPATGAHNVVVTFTSSHYILTGAIEYSGVQGVDVTYKEDAYTNSKTTSITTTANNAWPVIFATTAGLSQSAGTGATARTGAATNYWKWFDSNAAITPAGAYSMNTTSYSGSGICHIIISLKPY